MHPIHCPATLGDYYYAYLDIRSAALCIGCRPVYCRAEGIPLILNWQIGQPPVRTYLFVGGQSKIGVRSGRWKKSKHKLKNTNGTGKKMINKSNWVGYGGV